MLTIFTTPLHTQMQNLGAYNPYTRVRGKRHSDVYYRLYEFSTNATPYVWLWGLGTETPRQPVTRTGVRQTCTHKVSHPSVRDSDPSSKRLNPQQVSFFVTTIGYLLPTGGFGDPSLGEGLPFTPLLVFPPLSPQCRRRRSRRSSPWCVLTRGPTVDGCRLTTKLTVFLWFEGVRCESPPYSLWVASESEAFHRRLSIWFSGRSIFLSSPKRFPSILRDGSGPHRFPPIVIKCRVCLRLSDLMNEL